MDKATDKKEEFANINGYDIVALVEHMFEETDTSDGQIVTSRQPGAVGKISNTQCDHCNVSRFRRKTWVLEKDNERFLVGTSCVHKFVDVPEGTITTTHLQGEDINGVGQAFPFPVRQVILAGMGLIARHGSWVAAKETLYKGLGMGKLVKEDFMYKTDGIGRNTSKIYKAVIDAKDLNLTEKELTEFIDASIAWVNTLGTDSDFANNLKTHIDAGWIRERDVGTVAWVAQGFAKEFQKWIKAVSLAEFNATKKPIPANVATGEKVRLEGTVTSNKVKYGQWGDVMKMVVQDDRGFLVWGTNTMDLKVGDRVVFTAKVTASDKDETFGFFKYPKKVS